MATANVNCFIPASAQRVFDVITDHGNYDQLDSVAMSKLLKPGEQDRNGLKALRELIVSHIRFIEVITCYTVPSRMEYRVKECYWYFGRTSWQIRFPLIHNKGVISLEERDGGTQVNWLSQFSVDVPFGGYVARLMQPMVEQTFKRILNDMAEMI